MKKIVFLLILINSHLHSMLQEYKPLNNVITEDELLKNSAILEMETLEQSNQTLGKSTNAASVISSDLVVKKNVFGSAHRMQDTQNSKLCVYRFVSGGIGAVGFMIAMINGMTQGPWQLTAVSGSICACATIPLINDMFLIKERIISLKNRLYP